MKLQIWDTAGQERFRTITSTLVQERESVYGGVGNRREEEREEGEGGGCVVRERE